MLWLDHVVIILLLPHSSRTPLFSPQPCDHCWPHNYLRHPHLGPAHRGRGSPLRHHHLWLPRPASGRQWHCDAGLCKWDQRHCWRPVPIHRIHCVCELGEWSIRNGTWYSRTLCQHSNNDLDWKWVVYMQCFHSVIFSLCHFSSTLSL